MSPDQQPAQRLDAASSDETLDLGADPTSLLMYDFQQVMQRFLQTQENVMLELLRATDSHSSASLPLLAATPPTYEVPAAEASFAAAPEAESVPRPAAAAAPEPALAAQSPAAAVASSVAAPATAPAGPDVAETLLTVVSERTGYPPESLALDADLEADLGVDSIKRVEIAGELLRRLSDRLDSRPDLEQLASKRTLREIIAFIEAARVSPPTSTSAAGATMAPAATAAADRRQPVIERFVPRPVPIPGVSGRVGLDLAGQVLIVEDGGGVGEALAGRLAQAGYRPLRIAPDAVPGLVEKLRGGAQPAVSALVFLPSLRSASPALDLAAHCLLPLPELEALLELVQALQPQLVAAGPSGGRVLVATLLGGGFGFADASSYLAGDGGIVGFIKTLAQEWPAMRPKALDLAPAAADALAERIFDELTADDNRVEVGYGPDGQRVELRLAAEVLPDAAAAVTPLLPDDAVVLVTGGARGITAAVAQALAAAHRPTLILVGRTPVPAAVEAPETAGLDAAREIKKVLFERLRSEGSAATPVAIESRYQGLLREREVRATLTELDRAGARAVYVDCDVRDMDAFAALIDGVYARYGRLDGVIHGAGVIEDRLLADKGLESFRRVIETKVNGAAVLASRLRPEGLRFLVFFSSVSGRFGNRGQADYAAANEVLNKLAQTLDSRWPGRVVAVNWGPWSSTGMVSAEAERQFAERGVDLIPVELGCRMLLQELAVTGPGYAEVVIAGLGPQAEPFILRQPSPSLQIAVPRPDQPAANGHHAATAPGLPLLAAQASIELHDDGELVAVRTLSLEHDLYLRDHVLDGKPVLPFTVAMELMAEAAQTARPDLDVVAIRGVRALRGVVLEGATQTLRVAARRHAGDAASLDLSIVSGDNPAVTRYNAVVELGKRDAGLAASALDAADALATAPPFAMSVADAYNDWLFHGPLFEAITAIEAMGPAGVRATLRASDPAQCLASRSAGAWLLDPILLDAAFQLQLLWCRQYWDLTLLPSAIEAVHFGPAAKALRPGESVRCELVVRPASQPPMVESDIYLTTLADRAPLLTVIRFQATGSRGLNRLSAIMHGRAPTP